MKGFLQNGQVDYSDSCKEASDDKERLTSTSPDESPGSGGASAASVLILSSSSAALGSKGNDNLISHDEDEAKGKKVKVMESTLKRIYSYITVIKDDP